MSFNPLFCVSCGINPVNRIDGIVDVGLSNGRIGGVGAQIPAARGEPVGSRQQYFSLHGGCRGELPILYRHDIDMFENAA
jgi:hypothetical protein